MEIKLFSLIRNSTLIANAMRFYFLFCLFGWLFFWLVQGWVFLVIAVLGEGLMTRKVVLASEHVSMQQVI